MELALQPGEQNGQGKPGPSQKKYADTLMGGWEWPPPKETMKFI